MFAFIQITLEFFSRFHIIENPPQEFDEEDFNSDDETEDDVEDNVNEDFTWEDSDEYRVLEKYSFQEVRMDEKNGK